MALIVDEARKNAESLLRDYWFPRVFPVDVEHIAWEMGIRTERTFLKEGVSGMIRSEPGTDPTIYVDESEIPTRQRFTIAHELGHYVERSNLGKTRFAFIDERGSKYDLHEFYADEFAGNLLMPHDDIMRMKNELGMSNIEIAARFGVSGAAVAKRLARIEKAALARQ